MGEVSTPAFNASAGSEKVLASVLRSSPDAIVLVDCDEVIGDWNAAAARMFGIPRDKALGEAFEELFPPDRQSDAHELLLNTSLGRTDRRTTVAVRNDGSRLLVEATCSTVRGSAEDELSGYAVILRDVTEPLLVRSAASAVAFGADPSAALESFAQVLGQVIPVDNLTLTAVEGSDARRVASGGRCAKKLRSGEILPLEGSPLGAAVNGRRPFVCLDTRCGDLPYDAVLAERGVRSYVVLPLFHVGRVVATLNVAFASANAPSARVVQLLGSLNASIMPTVLNLVALEEQGGAIRRLEQLDDLKNEFLALITHDIRTPLAVIAGFADELQNGWNDLTENEKLESVDVILRNGRNLYRLVEEGLQVARIESGAFAYDLRAVVLEAEVERVIADLGSVVADRIRVSTARDLPPVRCDPDRHWQILMNLLSNALKFSRAGTLIDIGLRRQEGMVEVAVRDRGPGIPRADQPKLFQKFSRVGSSEQHGVRGAGLGLYIAKAIVEAQGGRIRMRNRPGGGSTFAYTLPIAELAEP
jgi:PAS domain S-box-containing protein